MRYAELRDILGRANSFEWDANSYAARGTARNPNKFLTPSCFWAMNNSQYFPYAAYLLATDEDANQAMLQDIKSSAKNMEAGLPFEEDLDNVETLVAEQNEEMKAIEKAEVALF